MWLLTPLGFFSIVRKPDDVGAGTLTIRARVKSDLEALREHCLPNLGVIEENAGTDYRYRAKAQRGQVAEAFAQLVQDLDYDNFKNEVVKKQGKHRAAAYGRVWDVLCELQTGSEQHPSRKSIRQTKAVPFIYWRPRADRAAQRNTRYGQGEALHYHDRQ